MSFYPSGYVGYFFSMYVFCDSAISCDLDHSVVRRVVLEKLNCSDVFCPEWKMTIHLGPIESIECAVKAGEEVKEKIFDLLSFKLNTKISGIRLSGYGLEPKNGEGGSTHSILPPLQCQASGRTGCMPLSNDTIKDIQSTFAESPDFGHRPLAGLFRHALNADDPVVQFMCLYLILDVSSKNQSDIDEKISLLEPATPKSASPRSGNKTETVYTRLRNELVHRAVVNPETTRNEILGSLDSFKEIARRVVAGEGSTLQQ